MLIFANKQVRACYLGHFCGAAITMTCNHGVDL